ncbi:MAG: hypothetical protein OXC00_03085 [Acidimicrobiaceae bacterium]|nr:hypothetical protein [Acidimicrobiaceae bacterium]
MVGVFALETILGMDAGVFMALTMFAVFMAVILSGYNVAFSFAATALFFSFVGDWLACSTPTRSTRCPDGGTRRSATRRCWRCRCSC